MRVWFAMICAAPWLFTACAGHKPNAPSTVQSTGTTPLFAPLSGERVIVTPENGLVGKVAKVNLSGRFVILNFPIGHLPSFEQRLNVYRLGLKVGEVKITGPQLDDNVVGDLINGEAQLGDEVRDR